MELSLMALPRDNKTANFNKVKQWAAQADRAEFIKDDFDLAEGVTPFFKSRPKLSMMLLKSLYGEELRQFMVLHSDCMTSVAQGGILHAAPGRILLEHHNSP